MKSFALHLVFVALIVGVHLQQFKVFCSPTASLSAIPTVSTFTTSGLSTSTKIVSNRLNHSSSLSTFPSTKTPRTIQRLIGGHLQHTTRKRPLDESITTTTQLSKAYFRRKPIDLRNSYQLNQTNTILKAAPSSAHDLDDYYGDGDGDAALLEDPQDFENWDNGILRLSAGGGKDEQTKSKKTDDSKKTLSEQVKDGKYGLIEKELFQNTPTRPGVISYLSNKQVPNDNPKNYGGLNEDDIWLAEDHLLVLKGGALNSDEKNEPWEPIDDYEAPTRQIKIPSKPKVPPPFPVQFEDNGPIQFIGDHKFSFFYPFTNESLFNADGHNPTEANRDNQKNLLAGTGSIKNSTKGGYFYPQAIPPWFFGNNETFTNPFLNIPSGPQFPPNAGLDNSTDYFDEDDPSLYYPPPYSFVYKSNYSSPIAPGPLVPGIVLPPPPNAFARLEELGKKTVQTNEIPFRQVLTKITDYKPNVFTAKPPTTSTTTTTTTTVKTTTLQNIPKPKEVYRIKTRPQVPERTYTYSTPNQIVPTPTIKPQILRQEIVSFIPKMQPTTESLTNGNPIYYEYFDAKPSVPENERYYNQYQNVDTTTQRPPNLTTKRINSVRPIFKEVTHARPQLSIPLQRQNQDPPQRLSKSYLPTRQYNYDDYLLITPKPEIKPNGIANNPTQFGGNQQFNTVQNFEHEVDAIRQTLQYYNNQQIQQNNIPRTPKPKAVYEYSFDATVPRTPINREFQPPTYPQFDEEPFKPMVQYSRPVNDANGFQAIEYANTQKLDAQQPNYYSTTPSPSTVTKQRVNSRVKPKSYTPYPGNGFSTTLRPVEYTTPQRNQRPYDTVQYPSSQQQAVVDNNRQPFISIEKRIVQEVGRPPQFRQQKVKNRGGSGYSRNINGNQGQFNGYYYSSPTLSSSNGPRQNNRYYEEPFSQHLNAIKSQLNQYQAQPSLENDTYVNYSLDGGRQINPNAEFIQVSGPRRQQYQALPQNQAQRLPPSIPPNVGRPNNPPQYPYQPQISLYRDILVNYKFPLLPINRDSEYIQPQIVSNNNRNVPPPQFRPPPQYNRPPVDQSGVYYLSPRDVRHNNN